MCKRIKRFLFPFVELVMRVVIPLLAPLYAWAARYGTGSDACLRRGFLPLPVHFYSPVPDIDDLRIRDIWSRKSDMPGVAFRPEMQLTFIRDLGRKYGDECRWPAQDTGDRKRYYTENQGFSFGCAATTHTIIRDFKPNKVVEIGSGSSSLVIAEALLRNVRDGQRVPPEHVIIDPYPQPYVESGLSACTRLEKKRVELLEASFFDSITANDVLFIDSGHTVRTGGDVNFLLLEVVPRLKKGVIIHVHDIPLPYEYPEVYSTNPRFRVFWTEGYLLHAFLCFNQRFEILLAMNWLMRDHPDHFRAAFRHYDPALHRLVSSSFWMRRRE